MKLKGDQFKSVSAPPIKSVGGGQSGTSNLKGYQQDMVEEAGPRQANSSQNLKGSIRSTPSA